MNVTDYFEQTLGERGFTADAAQRAGLARLQQCYDEWVDYKSRRSSAIRRALIHPDLPRGVYFYGGVGRGKSMLMDAFFVTVPIVRKTRLHFHEFMREVQREMAALQGTVDPLAELSRRIARRFRLICFDEFHISDVTDAMILHRLLQGMFDNGVQLVATSNFHPDALYPDGLHRDRILPAIELIKQKMDVVHIDGGVDYRLRALAELDLYLTPLGPQAQNRMEQAFERMAGGTEEDPVLHIEGREVVALQRSGGVVWFSFHELCETPRSQNDYLEIASRFHTVLLSDVPQMSEDMASAARRFTLLIDVLYDRRIKLILSAAVPPEQLYVHGPLDYEFSRTVSRLNEMQSADYLRAGRRQSEAELV
ncbi:MAG: cell division protein ZapE [Thiomonas sp. 20-64-5]|nr:MAG: cell division protein ZapE [Thiomonas sp. 20-64-5]